MPFPDPNNNPAIPAGGILRLIPGAAGLFNILQNGAGDLGGAAFSGLGGLVHNATGLGMSQAPVDGGPHVGPFRLLAPGVDPNGEIKSALRDTPLIGGLIRPIVTQNDNPQGSTNYQQWDPNYRYQQANGESMGNFRNRAWRQSMYQNGGINPYTQNQTPFSNYVQGQAGLMGERYDIARALSGTTPENESDARGGYLAQRLQNSPNMSVDDMNRSFGGLRDLAAAQARGDVLGEHGQREFVTGLNDARNPNNSIQAIEALIHGHGNSSWEQYDDEMLQRAASQYMDDPTVARGLGSSPSFFNYMLSRVGR